MDKLKHNIIAKKHRDKKKIYIKNLEQENLLLKKMIDAMRSQILETHKNFNPSLFLPTPSKNRKKEN